MKSELSLGDQVTSPGGRMLLVEDIFVPKSNVEKGQSLPSRFRHLRRKVVVFHNGSITTLNDIQQNYRVATH